MQVLIRPLPAPEEHTLSMAERERRHFESLARVADQERKRERRKRLLRSFGF